MLTLIRSIASKYQYYFLICLTARSIFIFLRFVDLNSPLILPISILIFRLLLNVFINFRDLVKLKYVCFLKFVFVIFSLFLFFIQLFKSIYLFLLYSISGPHHFKLWDFYWGLWSVIKEYLFGFIEVYSRLINYLPWISIYECKYLFLRL